MKKFIKFCALTGLILLLAGIGITSVSAALGGRFSSSFPHRLWARIWDDDDYWDNLGLSGSAGDNREWRQWNEDDPEAFSGARKLDVDIDKGVLRVYEKDDISQIEVNVYDKYDATRCYMDEETLKIKRENGRHRSEDIRVEVLVPAGYLFDKISVDMGAAQSQLDGIHTSKLDIDTGVGEVTFNGTVTGDVEVETGVGDVTLNLAAQEADYNYRIECGVGAIRVGGSQYSMLSHSSHINNNAPYTMELECGVGNITVNFDEQF